MPAMVETMFSAGRKAPWHGLGVTIEEAPDSREAIRLAGLDWDVSPVPIYTSNGQIPNTIANVRSDNGNVLGIVTERYNLVQNSEAFTFTDSLIQDGEVRYETAGSLKDGRQIWMLAKMQQDYDILGDKIDPYLCFINSHDGTGAVRVLMTPVRVVCQNTLNLAIRQSTRSWSTTHVGDIAAKFSQAQQTLGLATNYMEALNKEANDLVDIKLNHSQFIEVLNEILPIDTRLKERASNNVLLKREAIQRAMRQDDISKFNGTAWQVINAVSDFIGHTEPQRNTATYKENNFSRVISGDLLLDKTYDILRSVA